MLAANLVAGGWGALAWARGRPSAAFWYLLRTAQATVIAEVVAGFVLYAGGRRAESGLHIVYGVSPLVVTLVTEAMRVGAAQHEVAGVEDVDALERREQVLLARRVVLREIGIMSIGALLIATLALRALTTG